MGAPAGPTRLQIRDALFTFISAIPGFVDYRKRWALPLMLPNQPVLVMRKMSETTKRQQQLKVRTFEYWLYGYFTIDADPTNPDAPSSLTPGEDTFDPLLDSIEAAFDQTDDDGRLTLGGLVSHCWIEGDTLIGPGDGDAKGQGFIVVPIKILVP